MEKIELTRRKFIIGASTSLIAAPAIVRIASLMPINPHWDMNKWYHIILNNEGGAVETYIDSVRITNGVARYTEKFLPLQLDGETDWLSIPDNVDSKKPFTFEFWTNKKGNYDNVRLTKGNRYGVCS